MTPSAEAKIWWVVSRLRMGWIGEQEREDCAKLLEEALVEFLPIHSEDCTHENAR